MKFIVKYLKNPIKLINPLGSRGYLNWMSDETYLKLVFKGALKQKLNLKNPKSFNEKLQWLKLYDRKSEYSMYVDKYEVRKYIAETIGEEYLIPLIGVYESVDEISWDKLPRQFVLKCTHGSGSNIICSDKSKLDIKQSKKKLRKWMKKNWYWFGREWPYKKVKPRIICEKYMADGSGTSLTDYKFYCFNGNPTYCQIIRDRGKNETIDFYDENWKHMYFSRLGKFPHSIEKYEKPDMYEMMFKLVKQLAGGYPFIRVDFYYIKNEIYFGELTFFPTSGFQQFYPNEWNQKLGDLIKLPVGK